MPDSSNRSEHDGSQCDKHDDLLPSGCLAAKCFDNHACCQSDCSHFGRAGEKGLAFSLYTEIEVPRIISIEDFTGVESQYGQVQRENMHKMVEIHKKQARSTGIYGFWRNITGAARRDQDELVKLEANFENIAQRQKEAFSAFEHERMQKLEVLKKEYSPIYEPELKKEFDPVGEDIDRDELAAFLEQKEAAKQRVQDQTRGIDRS